MTQIARVAAWIRVRDAEMKDGDTAALVLPDLADDEKLLEGEITMAGQPVNEHIIVAALRSPWIRRDLSREDALDPWFLPTKSIDRLKDMARRRLRSKMNKDSTKEGLAVVSTSTDGMPVIDRAEPNGPWLCFGFGMNGTMLAPGAAQALVRRLCGKESGMDDSTVAIAT